MTSHTVLEAKAEQGRNWIPNCPCFKWEQLKPVFRAKEPNTSNSYVLFVLSRPESQDPRILEPKELAWSIVPAKNAYAVYEKLIKSHYNVEEYILVFAKGKDLDLFLKTLDLSNQLNQMLICLIQIKRFS